MRRERLEIPNRVRALRRRAGRVASAALALALSVAHAGALASPPAEAQISEYHVKAAFLLNFTRFVVWPSSAFADAASPLVICVLGDDPFGGVLDQVVEGESANGRRVAVRRIRRAPAPTACHVLFVGRSERDVHEILSAVGPGVLTVGDTDDFLRHGGMIAFVIEDRRVRFDVSQRASLRAGLSLSSRLLNVARHVEK